MKHTLLCRSVSVSAYLPKWQKLSKIAKKTSANNQIMTLCFRTFRLSGPWGVKLLNTKNHKMVLTLGLDISSETARKVCKMASVRFTRSTHTWNISLSRLSSWTLIYFIEISRTFNQLRKACSSHVVRGVQHCTCVAWFTSGAEMPLFVQVALPQQWIWDSSITCHRNGNLICKAQLNVIYRNFLSFFRYCSNLNRLEG